MLVAQFADLPPEYKKDLPPLHEVYRLDPTPECPSGTRGRIAVFEMFDMTLELERAILANKPEDEMFSIVRKNGMLTMKEDAIIKSAQGTIPFEEVNTLGGEFELGAPEALDIQAPPPVELKEDGSMEIPSTQAQAQVKDEGEEEPPGKEKVIEV
jgi:hypothetical protein